MSTIIQVRRDTAAQWLLVNPVLAQGETGLETDTGKTKTGTGLPGATWSTLPYDITGGGGGSALTVQDEGSTLTTAATKFNFIGGGVTVTEPVPDELLVNIPAPPAPAITGVGDTATIDLTLSAGTITGVVKPDSIGSAELNPTVDAALALAHAAVTVLDSAHIDFTLTGQQITATVKPDSIGSAELDPTVDAALALSHAAVTVTDSATIDLTLTGQDITASVKPDSIGSAELDPATDAALALAHDPATVGDTATIDLSISGQHITGVVVADSIGLAQLDPTVEASLGLSHAAATVTDSSTIDFTLTGQNITAIVKPDSIGANELDPTVDAALAQAHAAVTVTDSATIDFTLTGQDITAVVKPDSIGTAELAPAVETTLAGFVVGPASAVDNDVARFDGITGKLLKAGLKYQTAPEDGTAGVLLMQNAWGLNTSLQYTDEDFNDLANSGFYEVLGSGCTNQPVAHTVVTPTVMFVGADDLSNQCAQITINDNTSVGPILTYRIGSPSALGGSGVWAAWTEMPISIPAPSSADLNTNYLKSGFYSCDGTAANSPTAAAGHLFVQRASASPVNLVQLFIVGNTGASSSPSPIYLRTRNGNTATWTPWHKIYDSVGQNVNTSPTGSLGFATGAGGTITQITSKATAVTLAKPCGNIITHAATLNANTDVVFTLINSLIAANDTVHVCVAGPSSSYVAEATYVRAGNCDIVLRNRSAGNLSEAVTINFVVIKGAIS